MCLSKTLLELSLEIITPVAEEGRLLSERQNLIKKVDIILPEELNVAGEIHAGGRSSHGVMR